MATATAPHYDYLRRLVMGHSQNVLDPSRDYLFDARLSRLLRNQGMSRLEELVRALSAGNDPALEKAIAEAMTINETSFFRDLRPFELLRTELLPQLIKRRRGERKLRFWSAASSTGQEAVSLTILLREHFPQIAHWDIAIEGTDICGDAVKRARAGRYHRIEVNRGMPARLLVKYFEQSGEDWVVKNEIRAACHFRQANLCAGRLPFTRATDRFDLILLRNVLLYFSHETRKTLMSQIHQVVAADGFLLLGSSEQADSSLWTSVLAGGTCYYKPETKGLKD
jgi:chemotaxis protein methyltransferase CheR